MSAIKDFLKAELAMMKTIHRSNARNGWYSCNHFVLKNGRMWGPHPLPKGVKKMKTGQCFANAARMAIDSSEFIYCEGVGLSIIPVQHAWCLDKDGRVIDPTWASLPFEGGREYFGVAIKTKYLIHHLLDTKKYGGVIDAWEAGWPLFTAPVQDWRHEINDLKKVKA